MKNLRREPSEDWEGFRQEFINESPRAAVLLGASLLDMKLLELLKSFLIDDRSEAKKFLEGATAPLGNLSARTQAAYLLGVITEDEYNDLNEIRLIRNKFAHRLHDMSFEHNEIITLCNKLRIPKYYATGEVKLSRLVSFRITVAYLADQLQNAILKTSRNRRITPKDQGAEVVDRLKYSGIIPDTTWY